MRDARADPGARRHMAMARYAPHHNQAQAARHFGCYWATIRTAVHRVAEYERTGDIRVLQNQARGKSGRTRPEVEARVIEIYHESFEPERPQGRRYSAAKMARLLKKQRNMPLCHKTVWSILRRRGLWESESGQKKAVQRFERAKQNKLC